MSDKRTAELAAHRRGEIFGFTGDSYQLIDPRRKLERRDFEMINEDHNAMANLPTRAQNHEFPKEVTLEPFILRIR